MPGIRHGRESRLEDLRAECRHRSHDTRPRLIIATRGERLILISGGCHDTATATEAVDSGNCSPSSKPTPTNESRRARCSIPTTSMPRSLNSTRDTSPAKRRHTRTPGGSSRRPYAGMNRGELPHHDCGLGEHRPSTCNPDGARRRNCRPTSHPLGILQRISRSISKLCIGSVTSERSSRVWRRTRRRRRASTPNGEPSISSPSTATASVAARSSTNQTSTLHSQGSRSCIRRRTRWKMRQHGHTTVTKRISLHASGTH